MKKTIKYYFQQCKKALKKFNSMIENLLISIILFLLRFYNYFISPMLGVKCRFLPTCSEYCYESLKKHGLIKGIFYCFKRVSKCHPFKILGAKEGIDLVPEKNNESKESN